MPRDFFGDYNNDSFRNNTRDSSTGEVSTEITPWIPSGIPVGYGPVIPREISPGILPRISF